MKTFFFFLHLNACDLQPLQVYVIFMEVFDVAVSQTTLTTFVF